MRADEILYSASQLAKHLRRSGVLWLPNAADASVQRLMESFEQTDRDPANSAAKPRAKVRDSPASDRQATRAGGTSDSIAAKAAGTRASVLPISAVGESYPGETLPLAERKSHLDAMASAVADCTRCSELVACRKQTVFGEGSPTPRFAFFGEGPGADEDRTGRPFVGRAGQLLTKMIEACTLKREDVYILNTVKCRPPGNRNPEATEVENCREYFEGQLSTLRPEYIVCLGAVAAQSLLRSKLPVGRLRGRVHEYFDSKVIVTYHPAYLLRNPSAKKAAWDDLQLMLRHAGVELPGKR